MLKRIIATSLVAMVLMFSGCGETDSVGQDRLSAQTSIDSGDYSAAITLLEAKPAAQRTDSDNLLLASAYMSRAGFSLTDIMVSVDAASSSDVSGDDLDNFKASVLTDLSATALADINKAILAYEAIDGLLATPAPALAASNVGAADIGLSDNQLKLGLAYIIKFAIMLDGGATDADLAVIANNAFDYIIGVAPTDLKSKVQAVKDDIDKNSSGVIEASELTMYR